MTHETDPTGRSAHDPGSKLDAGKPRPALVLGGFARALSAVTQVGTFGATKYTDNGWRTVPNGVERYTEAMVRHYLAEAQGLESDPDSKLLHAAHLAWNALARLELMLSGPDKHVAGYAVATRQGDGIERVVNRWRNDREPGEGETGADGSVWTWCDEDSRLVHIRSARAWWSTDPTNRYWAPGGHALGNLPAPPHPPQP